ncbi:hypothetical protein D1BOALGB6SA_5508 [Olavius sp. associated proteobacterium Delta 1]|nr:hypothetical protein D1BOALGB6SA_5508 [Olavius sp. associated proteobacterium Delta 1]
MKKTITVIIFLAALIFTGNAFAGNSIRHSGKSLSHSGQSIKHSAQGVGHGSMAGAKLTSGVIAIPLKVAGEVSATAGHISNTASEDLWNTASGNAFELTDQSFIKTGLPPHEAIQE